MNDKDLQKQLEGLFSDVDQTEFETLFDEESTLKGVDESTEVQVQQFDLLLTNLDDLDVVIDQDASLHPEATAAPPIDYPSTPIYHQPDQPRFNWRWLFIAIALIIVLILIGWSFGGNWLAKPAPGQSQSGVGLRHTSTPTASATPSLTLTHTPITVARVPDFKFEGATATPAPVPGGQILTLRPSTDSSGWVAGNEETFITIYDAPNHFQDESYLYAGSYEGQTYHGAFQFDVSQIPRGTKFHEASIRLTGLRVDQLGNAGEWRLHLLSSEVDYGWDRLDYKQIHRAQPWITFEPILTQAELGVGKVNVFKLTPQQLKHLEQHHLAGSGKFSFRLDGPETGNNLFAWNAGFGDEFQDETAEQEPLLFLSVGPPPEATPLLNYIIITSTPTPENLEAAVANSLALTAEAKRIGTATPLPPNWVTPIVVTATPTAENEATAQAMQAQATAIALTTGEAANVVTATPTPTFVLITSTPTSENVMTAAARSVEMTTEAAHIGTATPLPNNWVTPIVVTVTPSPVNEATAQHWQEIATAQAIARGTSTPTPPNLVTATRTPTFVVITTTPTPETVETAVVLSYWSTVQATQVGTATSLPANWVTPFVVTSTPIPANQATAEYYRALALTTGTPTPLPENIQTATPTAVFTPVGPFVAPTSTATATPPPQQVPSVLVGKILFWSDREGATELARLRAARTGGEPEVNPQVYFFDPATGDMGRLADIWPYDVAVKRDAWSADKRFYTFTSETIRYDPTGKRSDAPTIFWFDTLYAAQEQATHFGSGIAYDGVWSPVAEQIAFVSTDSGNDEIWVINRDGSGLNQLTKNAWEWDKHPSWSPNGEYLVFSSNRTGRNQIWLMRKDGSEQRLLMPENLYSDWNPVWVKYQDLAPAFP